MKMANTAVQSKTETTTTQFSWTDKEIELLLENIKSFKVDQETKAVDWETVKVKYEKITEIFHENYQRFLQGEPLKYVVDFSKGY